MQNVENQMSDDNTDRGWTKDEPSRDPEFYVYLGRRLHRSDITLYPSVITYRAAPYHGWRGYAFGDRRHHEAGPSQQSVLRALIISHGTPVGEPYARKPYGGRI